MLPNTYGAVEPTPNNIHDETELRKSRIPTHQQKHKERHQSDTVIRTVSQYPYQREKDIQIPPHIPQTNVLDGGVLVPIPAADEGVDVRLQDVRTEDEGGDVRPSDSCLVGSGERDDKGYDA